MWFGNLRTIWLVAICAFVLVCGVSPLQAEDPVRFSLDVKPILSNNCFKCHGPDPNTRKGGLRLDVEADARAHLEGGSEVSEVFARLVASDALDKMPPPDSGLTLTGAEVEIIRRWLDQGAPYEAHWSFVPPIKPEIPTVQNSAWAISSVDNFVLSALESKGVTPSPEADKITLLRRVHLDLIGLPPTVDEVDAFLIDVSADAYEKVVERLLASPHFGERWGRHWLDAARYADSNGYSIDGPRSIWPYRDWVVNALNADMPFDQFVLEQMAGDLLPDATDSQKVATGFNRNTMINQEGGVDPEEFRLEAVFDRVNTTGTVFLGLTMACARCHAHKYDPIQHDEYFRLMAFFNSDDEPTLELLTEEERDLREQVRAEIRRKERELQRYFERAKEKQGEWEAALTLEKLHELEAETRVALATPPAERTDAQAKVAEAAFQNGDSAYQRRLHDIERTKKRLPDVASTLILRQRPKPRETYVFEQGDFTRPLEQVAPGVPAALPPLPEGDNSRLELAKWLCSPENPLTARVTVNRVWMHLFGRGIVETENDFGTQGALPTHPELLDWLAVRFVESGWSQKAVIREIVLSATYRQSSNVRPDLQSIDPDNKLLARQNRIRLDAEIIRDNALAVSGLLNPQLGGPPVYPPQPDGVMSLGQVERAWDESKGSDRYRRGLYTWFWRGTPHPTLTVFDAPSAQTACTRRDRSNTPLQALTLLNDQAFVEMAQALAEHLAAQGELSDLERIRNAFRTSTGREPSTDETETLRILLEAERATMENREAGELLAWTAVARTLLNLDEFITRE